MFNQIKSDFPSWIFLFGFFILAIEIVFFDWGAIFPLILFIVLILLGQKKRDKTKGKILFWIGTIGLICTAINMLAFKFIAVALFIYIAIRFISSKKHPKIVQPVIYKKTETESGAPGDPPVLKNRLFGTQKTPDHVYEWDDVNIQIGIGDTVIDLSNTLLPKAESVIVIRHIAGKVRILVPYDIEVAVYHSVIIGQAVFFDHHEPRLINETVSYRTSGFDQASRKIKIITSMIAGNLEVKRI